MGGGVWGLIRGRGVVEPLIRKRNNEMAAVVDVLVLVAVSAVLRLKHDSLSD